MAIGTPLAVSILQSCGTIYYATATRNTNKLVVAKSEFFSFKNNKKSNRSFVLLKTKDINFPICIAKIDEDDYLALLMECTHKSCELDIGGGIFTCPCHGSEFSIKGKVLEGPAERDLKTYKIETNNENIYLYLS